MANSNESKRESKYGEHELELKRFARSLGPEERELYKKAKGNTAKKQCREEIRVQRSLTNVTGVQSRKVEETKRDKKVGEYMNFLRLVESFGGNISIPLAMVPAKNWAN